MRRSSPISVGLSERDLEQIRAVPEAYDRTNAMALIALSAVDGKIAGIPGAADPVVVERTDAQASWPLDLQLIATCHWH